MNELKIFKNDEFGEIRTLEIENEPWFIGKDVCRLFGDKNHNRSIGRVDEIDKRCEEITDSIGRKQKAIFVNESGLYSLLFAMQPQKAHHDGVSDEYPIEIQERIDRLHRFKRWVTSEVLPAIRKHGAYATAPTIDKILDDPDYGIRLLQNLKEEREKRKALEVQNAVMIPKAVFADAVTTSDSCILIGDLAKLLRQNGVEIGQKRLFEYLRNHGFLIKRRGADWNSPTQRAMEMGLFEIKETAITHSDGHVTISKTTKVTGKGQIYFVNRFLGEVVE